MEQTLQIIYVRHGRSNLDDEITEIFGQQQKGSDGQELKISFSQYLARANARLSKLYGPQVQRSSASASGDGRIRRSRIRARSDRCARFTNARPSHLTSFIVIYCCLLHFITFYYYHLLYSISMGFTNPSSESRVCQNGHFAQDTLQPRTRCLGAKLSGWHLGNRPSAHGAACCPDTLWLQRATWNF